MVDDGRSYRHKDLISSLPDEILQLILSTLPTEFAIRSSVLSKRWRHVWYDTPSLSFTGVTYESINKTLALYKARKMTRFQLSSSISNTAPHINKWIKLVMSKNVEDISLDLGLVTLSWYHIPDFFYTNSSVKQLSLELQGFPYLRMPRRSVSWPSLKKLSLDHCELSPEFLAKILSGCPILESLALCNIETLELLDLSKASQLLRTLEIGSTSIWYPGPKKIVAPNIYCLKLTKSTLPCTLVDVSSLAEAKLDIRFSHGEHQTEIFTLKRRKETVLKENIIQGLMLEKLKNVEKLTFGANFLKILSLAELYSVPCPSFKVKDLTLETMVSKYVVPGLKRLLQNSPELKKLTLHITDSNNLMEKPIDEFLDYRGARKRKRGHVDYLCWSSEARVFENLSYESLKTKDVASFMDLMLKNTITLKKMVVRWEADPEGREFKELHEMVSMLSHNNYNVPIVLISTNLNQSV